MTQIKDYMYAICIFCFIYHCRDCCILHVASHKLGFKQRNKLIFVKVKQGLYMKNILYGMRYCFLTSILIAHTYLFFGSIRLMSL